MPKSGDQINGEVKVPLENHEKFMYQKTNLKQIPMPEIQNR